MPAHPNSPNTLKKVNKSGARAAQCGCALGTEREFSFVFVPVCLSGAGPETSECVCLRKTENYFTLI